MLPGLLYVMCCKLYSRLLQHISRMAGSSLLCISFLLKWLVELIINKQQDIRFIINLLGGW